MKLYNSLSNKIEQFAPIDTKKVTIYVCGITPYDTTHLGHAFTYISFDALIRYLKYQGYEVIYTQNVTDINDRDNDILQRAKEQNISWQKLAEFWTNKFLEDMKILNWTFPTHYLKASEQIDLMIQIIKALMKNGFAYQKNGNVYFDISRKEDFGKLSKLSKDQMLEKAQEFEEDLKNPDKRNPMDITLWRTATYNQPPHIPSFESPFGKGRPGWHIECSAMAISSLGETIDIHGGGKDLIYPHHEAEIAQSEGATGKTPFAKYWLHTGTVFYKGAKMSKSKGNLVMVSDLLKKYSPNALRWLLLSHHWHEDWEFREEDLIKAQKNIELINNIIAGEVKQSSPKQNLNKIATLRQVEDTRQGTQGKLARNDNIKQFNQFMDNNLNTPRALELLLKYPDEKIYTILGYKI